MSTKVLREIESFKRDMLSLRLGRLTETDRKRFDEIFPTGVPEKSLIDAIDLCDRTLDALAPEPGTARGEG